MSLSVAAKDRLLAHLVGQSAIGAALSAVGIHTGDPGVNGTANEVEGGGYERQTVTGASFTAPSADVDGAIRLSSALEFDGPANADATWFSVWAGATFMGRGQITSGDVAFNAEGRFNLAAGTQIDLNA